MSSAEWFRWAAAFFLGALATVLIEFGRGQFERRQRLRDRRDEFQKETLLTLQDGAMQLARLTAEVHAQIEEGKPYGFELGTSQRLASLDLLKYAARVRDGRTRTLADELQEAARLITILDTDADHQALRRRLLAAIVRLNSRIGELLRKL